MMRTHTKHALEITDLYKTYSSGRLRKWALESVSFRVKTGTCLGILGPNGSGKSTLLKLIAGLSLPTKGRIAYQGKRAALLDIGLGFHPELSGIENVFLSGALMGLRKKVIQTKLSHIQAFAGIGNAIHQAVKTYSNGMYVRLAFAVATQLESDLLLLDEVISMGDLSFQKQCRETFYTHKKAGKTILFVSHNLHELRSLADQYLILQKGRVAYFGSDTQALNQYIQKSIQWSPLPHQRFVLPLKVPHEGLSIQRLSYQSLLSRKPVLYPGEAIQISLHIRLHHKRTPPWVVYHLHDFNGQTLSTLSAHPKEQDYAQTIHDMVYQCVLKEYSLNPGCYSLSLYLIDFYTRKVQYELPEALFIHINAYPQALLNGLFHGPVRLSSQWRLVKTMPA